MFIGLHKLPKRYWRYVSAVDGESQRAKAIKDSSLRRYYLTEDGRRFKKIMKNIAPEIGMVESFRIVYTKEMK